MEFIPLHFGNKLKIANPNATVGLVCLWSALDYVIEGLTNAGIDLNSSSSKLAVIGNLYGNGIPQLLRNLLYNPQLTDIVICGADRSGSAGVLKAYFKAGLEKAESLGCEVTRIVGTTYVIDDLVTPDMFGGRVTVHKPFGDPHEPESISKLKSFLDHYTAKPADEQERIDIPFPKVEVTHFPSDPAAHCIAAETPLAAWREVVFHIARFGHIVHLRKGDRQELQNLKVVIRHPVEDDPCDLLDFGFDIEDLKRYQQDMVIAERSNDQPYTYGNRIRDYYGFDSLEKFAQRLRENPQDRDCYLALWDSHKDIDADDAPCLVSIFFRVFDNTLTLTAVYRTHNAMDAWLKNIYGLMMVQQMVSEQTCIPPGTLTVISQSISIDPTRYDRAQRVCDAKGFAVNLDPNGHFTISLEESDIVVKHFNPDGQEIKEYRSPKAERLQHELYRDCAISDIGHAIYIGRQLAKAEECLRTGQEYIDE